MRSKWFVMLSVLSLVALWPGLSLADDDKEVEDQIKDVDEDVHNDKDAKNVEEKLESQYNVSDQTIKNLRDKKFGYGEISTTLALAKKMDGGITDQNIQKIVDMRTGDNKKGWGQIAKEFDVKVGDLKKNIHATHDDAAETAKKHKKTGVEQLNNDQPSTTKSSGWGNSDRGHSSTNQAGSSSHGGGGGHGKH